MSTTTTDEADNIHVLAEVITTSGTIEVSCGSEENGKTGRRGRVVVGGTEVIGPASNGNEEPTYARTVVIGVDGSAQSYHAFHWYITNMHMDGNYVILVHAFEVPMLHSFQEIYISPDMWKATLKREASHTKCIEKRLTGVLNRCKIPGRFEARGGRPEYVLVSIAEEMEADIVIVGTRGHSKLRRAVLGSVSGHVTRHAPCPVMVCRQKGRHRSDSSGSMKSSGSSSSSRRCRQDSTGSPSSKVRFDMSGTQDGPHNRPRYYSTGSVPGHMEGQPDQKKPNEILFKSILSRKRYKSECDASSTVVDDEEFTGESGKQQLIPAEKATSEKKSN